jgi:hypothetical protein
VVVSRAISAKVRTRGDPSHPGMATAEVPAAVAQLRATVPDALRCYLTGATAACVPRARSHATRQGPSRPNALERTPAPS